MKWIGQQIYDFVSRFRNDVYLEDISTGTIASGGNLGLDSNNKIVKSDNPAGTIDLTSEVTGILPVANGGSGASSLTSNRVLTGNGSSAIQAEDNLYFQHPSLIIGADDDSMSIIQKAEHSDGHGGVFKIQGAPANAGQTDKNGGDIYISAGRPTGAGTFGEIQFYGGDVEGTGTSLRTNTLISKLAGNAATSTDFYLYERAGASSDDYFKASVAANGATTLSTTDGAGTAAGILTLDADGLINIDADRNGDINFQDDSVTFARFNNVGSTSNLFLYEAAGASSNDYFKIAANTNGDTTISTVDAAGTDANLTLDIDGTITIDSTDGIIDFQEDGASVARIQQSLGNILTMYGNSTGPGKISLREDTDNGTNDILIQAPSDISSNRIQLLPDASGTIQLQGTNAGKQLQTYFQSFGDDLGTTKHYLPFKDINEQTTIYQEEAAQIAPADGRIVSVTIRSSTLEGSGNRTIGIHTIGPNTSQFSASSWTEEETETVAYDAGDDNHVHHFAFSNDKHFESGELFVVSIQDDADLSSSFRYTYVTTIIEWDYSTWLGSTSAEFDSAP